MRGRVAIIALSLAAGVGVMVFLALERAADGRTPEEAWALEHLPPRRPYNPATRWTLTEHLTAHHVLIAHVETTHLDESLRIAHTIAEPRKTKFVEVLVYFHRPGRPDTLPPRRVQWTPAQGYVETVYD